MAEQKNSRHPTVGCPKSYSNQQSFEDKHTHRHCILNGEIVFCSLVHKHSARSRKFLICEPQLQPHGIVRRKTYACTQIRIGRLQFSSQREAALLQKFRMHHTQLFADDLLSVPIKSSAAHHAVPISRERLHSTGHQHTVSQIKIMQYRQKLPMWKLRRNFQLRPGNAHFPAKAQETKYSIMKFCLCTARNLFRIAPGQALFCQTQHIVQQLVITRHNTSLPCASI